MARLFEAREREIPLFTVNEVLELLDHVKLPGDTPFLYIVAMVQLVFCNTDCLAQVSRSEHPRRAAGERMGRGSWLDLLVNSFSAFANRLGIAPPTQASALALPEQYDASSLLWGLASLSGLLPFSCDSMNSDERPPLAILGINDTFLYPPIILCSEQTECIGLSCNRVRLYPASSDVQDSVQVVRQNRVHQASLHAARCLSCSAYYHPDRFTWPNSANPNADESRNANWSNQARYLRAGRTLYVDRDFGTLVYNTLYKLKSNYSAFATWLPSLLPGLHFTPANACSTFIHATIRLLGQELHTTLRTSARIRIGDLAAAAHQEMANPTPGVRVEQGGYFPRGRGHRCENCTKVGRRFIGEGRDNGVAGEQVASSDSEGEAIQVVDDQDQEIDSVVIDGIMKCGKRCGYKESRLGVDGRRTVVQCTEDLVDYRTGIFCAYHLPLRRNLCHVMDCNAALHPHSRACANHQAEWQHWLQPFLTGHTHAQRRRQQQRSEGEAQPWRPRLDILDPARHDNNRVNATGGQQPIYQHYFSPSVDYCLETELRVCGCPVGYSFFSNDEGPARIVRFHDQLWPLEDPMPRPVLVSCDKGCLMLEHLVNTGLYHIWRLTSRIVVDTFHWLSHKTTHLICRQRCNPLNGRDPNITERIFDPITRRYKVKSRFNLEAAEQLNVYLTGVLVPLRRMTRKAEVEARQAGQSILHPNRELEYEDEEA